MKDWKHIKQDTREKYKLYLCSREWNEKVVKVRERSKGICERCKLNSGGQTHHLTYIRLYKENLNDLADFCEACHKFVSGKNNFDPLIKKKENVKETAMSKNNFDVVGISQREKVHTWLKIEPSRIDSLKFQKENVNRTKLYEKYSNDPEREIISR